MYIETQRMIIREYTMGDSEDLYEIFGNAEVMKHCEPAYSPEKQLISYQHFVLRKEGLLPQFTKTAAK
ncbi:MAG: GNAT family N-acetyltransferase [Oscillospiraceae bacterium]|nr:GNAT family N-acetyltransferase [Oscillospiraceae bacterium]